MKSVKTKGAENLDRFLGVPKTPGPVTGHIGSVADPHKETASTDRHWDMLDCLSFYDRKKHKAFNTEHNFTHLQVSINQVFEISIYKLSKIFSMFPTLHTAIPLLGK